MLFKWNYKFVFLVTVFLYLIASGVTSVILAQDDTWTTIDGMQRSCCTASEVDGVIYVIGGYNVNPGLHSIGTSIVESYNPATGNWTTKSSMLTTRMLHSSCTVNGKIYAIGGYIRSHYDNTINIVEEYDPLTDTWTTKRSMPTKRACFAVGVVDGKIYVIGGSVKCSGVLNTVEIYDPATNIWKKKTGMPTPRVCLSTSAINGKIYAIGGARNNYPNYDPLETLEEYDPEMDTWTSRANMPTPRVFLTSSAVNGKIYVFGGSSIGNPFNVVSSVDVYTVPTTSVENTSTKMPIEFTLYQNYPNPFNPSTTITYQLARPSLVNLAVYDITGQLVTILENGKKAANTYKVVWNASSFASGIYFFRLSAGNHTSVRKMSLVK